MCLLLGSLNFNSSGSFESNGVLERKMYLGPAHQVYFIALHIVFADPAYAVYIAYKAKTAEKQNEPDVDQFIAYKVSQSSNLLINIFSNF